MKKRIRITFRVYLGLVYRYGDIKKKPFPLDFYAMNRWGTNLIKSGWTNMSEFLSNQAFGGENEKGFIRSYFEMGYEGGHKYKIFKTRELMVYEKTY